MENKSDQEIIDEVLKEKEQVPISVRIDRALKKAPKDRTEIDHMVLIKEMHNGSVRSYLLSMEEFK